MANLLKNARKSLLPALVALSMSCAMTPGAAFAEEAANVSEHSLSVADANGNAPVFAEGAWQLSSGTYTVAGTSQRHEGLRAAGDVTINLDGAAIDHSFPDPDKNTTVDDVAQYAPAISIESGSARINLGGANVAKGSPGHAGIYVAKGATLVIAGNGSLDAVGGNACPENWHYSGGTLYGVPLPSSYGVGENQQGFFTGGAGIGGNGIWTRLLSPNNVNICERVPESSSNFGTVRIDGGAISATGGNSSDKTEFGAGAGIGTGGDTGIATPSDTYWSLNNPFSGTVEINGGAVSATGGTSVSFYKTGGGAGIGTGGVAGNRYYCSNDVEISINGGQVAATGKSNGAGIGGGDNVPSGIIRVTDGFVTANGGDCRSDSPSNGGAGIGGGDGDWNYVWLIDISGGTIVATGAGDAAGIGTGNDGWLYGDVYLRGSANVTSYGGSGSGGGNGIDANKVHVWNQADVRIYAKGNGKGVVSNAFDVSGITSLWVQTENPNEPAIPNLLDANYSSPSTYLVTNWSLQAVSPDSGIAYGWLDLPSGNLEGDRRLAYEWTEAGLTIDGNLVPLSEGSRPTSGSWAALYSEPSPVDPYPIDPEDDVPDPVGPKDEGSPTGPGSGSAPAWPESDVADQTPEQAANGLLQTGDGIQPRLTALVLALLGGVSALTLVAKRRRRNDG